jgi:hypothetical protein
VPWKRVLADNEYTYVQRHRLPEGETQLIDPRNACKELCILWYNHLRVTGATRFQFRRVLADNGQIVATYDGTCTQRHSASTLTWSAPAKLYALHVDRQTNSINNARAWKSLPLARTEGVFVAISSNTMEHLRPLSRGVVDLCKVATLVNELEKFGPAHVSVY